MRIKWILLTSLCVTLIAAVALAAFHFLWPSDNKPVQVTFDRQHHINIKMKDIIAHIREQHPELSLPATIHFYQSLPQFKKQALIDQLILEEVYYRQGKNMHAKQMKRVEVAARYQKDLKETAKQRVIVSDYDLKSYYLAHRYQYASMAYIEFKECQFDSAEAALDALVQVNQGASQCHDAQSVTGQYRDIEKRYGPLMGNYLFSQSISKTLWMGPFESNQGFHIVQIHQLRHSQIPSLYEIIDKVRADYHASAAQRKYIDSKKNLLRRYEIEINY